MWVKAARAPFEHLGLGFVLRVGQRSQELLIARGTAHVFGRAAADSFEENRIDQTRMRVGDALDPDRMLPAIPEVVEIRQGLGAGVSEFPCGAGFIQPA